MKERVSIRQTATRNYLAINREAIGKREGIVFSIISVAQAVRTSGKGKLFPRAAEGAR